MRELNFKVGEERKIKINGAEYPILKTDVEVCRMLDDLAEKQDAINAVTKTAKQAREILDEMDGFSAAIDKAIDAMIGHGAAKKIFSIGNKTTVTVDEKMQIAAVISAAIVAEFKETAKSKFDLEEDKK